MSPTTQAMNTKRGRAHAVESVDIKRRGTTLAFPAAARRMLAMVVLLTAAFGFVGTPGAAAQSNPYECNNLFRSGHGYYGCGGLNHAWNHGTYGWILYYW